MAIEGGLRTFQPSRRLNTSVAAEPFLNGTSSNYVEEMYYAWLENPRSVHKVLSISVCVNCQRYVCLKTYRYAKPVHCYTTIHN